MLFGSDREYKLSNKHQQHNKWGSEMTAELVPHKVKGQGIHKQQSLPVRSERDSTNPEKKAKNTFIQFYFSEVV